MTLGTMRTCSRCRITGAKIDNKRKERCLYSDYYSDYIGNVI